MKHDVDNRSSALTTTRGLLYRPNMSPTLVHKRLKTRHAFYPPSVYSPFCFIARIRRRRPANGTQPYFAKRRTAKTGRLHQERMGRRNFYICSVFRRLRYLMANTCIFWTKRDIDNREGRWKVRRVSYIVQKIPWTLAHKRLKLGPDFLPTLTIFSVPVHRTPSNRH